MILARLLTGLLLSSGAVAAVLYLPPMAMSLLLVGIVGAAGFEWARFASVEAPGQRLAIAALAVIAAVVAFLFGADSRTALPLFVVGATSWVFAGCWVFAFQATGKPVLQKPAIIVSLGVLVLCTSFSALNFLQVHNRALMFLIFGVVWSADIFAYFGGRRFGKHKLANRISPGKTWEGFYFGLGGTLVVSLPLALFVTGQPLSWCLPVVALTFGAAVIGDLVESILKRTAGLKDSGSILPGHGGVLDRIDSLLAAAPVLASAIWMFE